MKHMCMDTCYDSGQRLKFNAESVYNLSVVQIEALMKSGHYRRFTVLEDALPAAVFEPKAPAPTQPQPGPEPEMPEAERPVPQFVKGQRKKE